MSGQLRGPAASCQRTLVLIKQQAGWAPGSIDTVPEKRSVFSPAGIKTPAPSCTWADAVPTELSQLLLFLLE